MRLSANQRTFLLSFVVVAATAAGGGALRGDILGGTPQGRGPENYCCVATVEDLQGQTSQVARCVTASQATLEGRGLSSCRSYEDSAMCNQECVVPAEPEEEERPSEPENYCCVSTVQDLQGVTSQVARCVTAAQATLEGRGLSSCTAHADAATCQEACAVPAEPEEEERPSEPENYCCVSTVEDLQGATSQVARCVTASQATLEGRGLSSCRSYEDSAMCSQECVVPAEPGQGEAQGR